MIYSKSLLYLEVLFGAVFSAATFFTSNDVSLYIFAIYGFIELLIILSERKYLLLPSSIFLISILIGYFVGPAVNYIINGDTYSIEPDPWLYTLIVILYISARALIAIFRPSIDEVLDSNILNAEGISNTLFLITIFLTIVCNYILYQNNVFLKTDSVQTFAFRSLYESFRTIIQFWLIIFVFKITKKMENNENVKTEVVLSGFAILVCIGVSILSGRKQDALIALGMSFIGYFSAIQKINKLKFILIVVLMFSLVFALTEFIYTIRKHEAFRNKISLNPIEIVSDAFSGNMDTSVSSGSMSNRLDLLEPSSRYFSSPVNSSEIMSNEDKINSLFIAPIPRVLYVDKPSIPIFGFRFGHYFGYTSYEDEAAIAFGYVVDLHFWFGYIGLLLLFPLIPFFLDRLYLQKTFPSLRPALAFYVFYMAFFVERFFMESVISLAAFCFGLFLYSLVIRYFVEPRIQLN